MKAGVDRDFVKTRDTFSTLQSLFSCCLEHVQVFAGEHDGT